MARLVFAGSPEFAVPGLQALLASRHEVAAVLTQPDRGSGRGRKQVIGPVKALAVQQGIPVYQPVSLRTPEALADIRAIDPDALVVIAYGQLLPAELLTLPPAGCINVHASLLPRWRGAAPIQAAVLAGDPQTGVCLMRMEAGLDTGPVYASSATAIGPRETAEQLQSRLAQLGADLLTRHLDQILSGELATREQNEAEATYAPRIQKSAAVIDWSQSAAAIDRQVRAYQPWPVAETTLDGARLRCWSVEPVAHPTPVAEAAVPGRIIGVAADGIDVSTGEGILRITQLQMPGRKRMAATDFARGHDVIGARLGE